MSTVAQPLTAYTDAQVAAALQVSRRTVYRLRKSGQLRSVRISRCVRVPAEALAEFLERACLNGERRDHRTGPERSDEVAGAREAAAL